MDEKKFMKNCENVMFCVGGKGEKNDDNFPQD